MNNNKSINIGSGWMKKGKNGKEFVSLRMGDQNMRLFAQSTDGTNIEVTNVLMFSNERKERENQPDFRLVVFTDQE